MPNEDPDHVQLADPDVVLYEKVATLPARLVLPQVADVNQLRPGLDENPVTAMNENTPQPVITGVEKVLKRLVMVFPPVKVVGE